MPGPRSLRLLARLLLPSSDREFIIGDLEELYEKRSEKRGVCGLPLLARGACFRSVPLGAPSAEHHALVRSTIHET